MNNKIMDILYKIHDSKILILLGFLLLSFGFGAIYEVQHSTDNFNSYIEYISDKNIIYISNNENYYQVINLTNKPINFTICK